MRALPPAGPAGQNLPEQAGQPRDLDTLATAPHDDAAEQAILGTALAAPEPTLRAAQPLTGADFHQPANGILWDTITRLWDTTGQADPITVADDLEHRRGINGRNLLDMIGGRPHLADLLGMAGVPADAQAWAAIIRRHATNRAILNAATRIAQQAHTSTDPTQIITAGRDALDQIASAQATTKTTAGMAAIMEHLLDTIGTPQTAGLDTPWMDLNRIIGGIQPGTLTVIGGRPATGKSMLALNLAEHVADKHSQPVLFCSLEMLARELGMRRLANTTGIPLGTLTRGPIGGREEQLIGTAALRLSGSPIEVADDAGQTATSIRATARALHEHTPLGMIVIDYLQLLTPERREQNREREVAAQSRMFKMLAQELDVPVVILSQLNRALVGRADKRPELTDLRESGAIEQDADMVWLLHHPQPEDPATLVLHVAKNRNGRAGESVELLQQGWLARISSVAKPGWGYSDHDDNEGE